MSLLFLLFLLALLLDAFPFGPDYVGVAAFPLFGDALVCLVGGEVVWEVVVGPCFDSGLAVVSDEPFGAGGLDAVPGDGGGLVGFGGVPVVV